MRRALASLVLGAALFASRAAAAEPERVAIDGPTMVGLALASHPAVEAAKSDRDAAHAAADAAQLARLPDLNVTARYARLSSIPERYRNFGGTIFPQVLNNLGVRGEVTLPLTDAFLGLAATARAAGKKAEAAELEVASARAKIAYEARVAFYTYASRAYATANAEDLVRVAERQAEDQRRKLAAGTAARTELLPYETALDSARMGLATAKADLGAAEATLVSYAPSLRGKAIVVPPIETILRVAPAPAQGPDLPVRVAALEAERSAAEKSHDAASLSRLPRITAYATGDMSAPSPRVFVADRLLAVPTYELGVRLEWSFSQATVGTARAAEARHRANAAAAQVEAARRTITAERAGARAQLAAADERNTLAEGRLARAQELARARQGELDAGTALPLAVVVAQSDVLKASNERVDAAIERAIAIAKIDFADGNVGDQRTQVQK